MSGFLWLVARRLSNTMARNATERKKTITPETMPIATLRKNFRMMMKPGRSRTQAAPFGAAGIL